MKGGSVKVTLDLGVGLCHTGPMSSQSPAEVFDDSRHNEFLTKQWERSVDNVVRDLRDLADKVERAKKVSSRIARPYLSNATAVVHQVMSANLHLARVIETAHECETLMIAAPDEVTDNRDSTPTTEDDHG